MHVLSRLCLQCKYTFLATSTWSKFMLHCLTLRDVLESDVFSTCSERLMQGFVPCESPACSSDVPQSVLSKLERGSSGGASAAAATRTAYSELLTRFHLKGSVKSSRQKLCRLSHLGFTVITSMAIGLVCCNQTSNFTVLYCHTGVVQGSPDHIRGFIQPPPSTFFAPLFWRVTGR